MNWVVVQMKWIMLISGILTCTMFYAALAPQASLRSTFGDSLTGPLAEIVVRNWGALIGLIGAMLIYGAYHAPVRPLVLTVAGLSKLAFIGLVLIYGRAYLGQQVGVAIAFDSAMVGFFCVYLIGICRQARRIVDT